MQFPGSDDNYYGDRERTIHLEVVAFKMKYGIGKKRSVLTQFQKEKLVLCACGLSWRNMEMAENLEIREFWKSFQFSFFSPLSWDEENYLYCNRYNNEP